MQGVKLAKNADVDKLIYSGYGITFDLHSELSLADGSISKTVIIFGVDMSSSVHINNKEKDTLIIGKGSTKGLHDTTLAAEAQCSINFSRSNRKFCLSLNCYGSNSFLFVNTTKIYQFKAKDSEIKKTFLALRKYFREFITQ